MSTETTNPLPEIDRSDILSALKSRFDSDDVIMIDWDQQLPSGTTGTSGGTVSRLSGTARVNGQSQTWSLIRKRLAPPEGQKTGPAASSQMLSSTGYWKREFNFYQSGLLDNLPDGFAAPHCYHSQEQADGCTLWLEEVQDEITPWPLDHFGTAACHLGHFNGLHLTERPIPDVPWLTVEIPRQREGGASRRFAKLDELRQQPVVRRGFPDDVAAGLLRIWHERDRFYQALNQLPRVLQHGDAGRKNLMARTGPDDAPETVAIDWGFGGVGAVGEEIACTVVSTVLWFNDVTPEQLAELEEIVLEGYLQGLRQAGWRGDSQLARLGYLCSVALRFGPLIGVPEVMALEVPEAERDKLTKQMFGWTLNDWIDILVPIRRFVIQRGEQARQLMKDGV